MLKSEGDRLDGRVAAEDAFAGYVDPEDGQTGEADGNLE